MKQTPVSPLAWVLLFALGMLWGTSYILIKKGLIAFSSQQVACIRMGMTALAFLPLFLLQYKQVDWSKWKQLATVGFAGSFLPALLFATAQTQINSSLAGILSSLTPLFTLLLGISFFGVTVSWAKVAGVLMGLFGAAGLLLSGGKTGEWGGVKYGSLVVLGTFFYALTNNVVKTHLHVMRSITISAVSYLIVGVPAIAYLFLSNFREVMTKHEHAWSSLGYLVILSMLGTVTASILFFKLIKETNALFASTVSYLIPIVALLWGVTDNEVITVWHFAGMALILAGVYVSRN